MGYQRRVHGESTPLHLSQLLSTAQLQLSTPSKSQIHNLHNGIHSKRHLQDHSCRHPPTSWCLPWARLRCRSPHQHPVDDSWLYPWHHSRSLHHPQVLECARWLPSPDDLNTPLDEARLTQSSSPFIHSSAFSGLHFQRGSWHGMFGIGFWEGLRWRDLITAGRSEGAKQHWLRNLDVLDMDLFCGHDCIRMGG